jgi:hypothetical protein
VVLEKSSNRYLEKKASPAAPGKLNSARKNNNFITPYFGRISAIQNKNLQHKTIRTKTIWTKALYIFVDIGHIF